MEQKIAKVVHTLQDPYLVSQFQNYFGVVRVKPSSTAKESNEKVLQNQNGVDSRKVISQNTLAKEKDFSDKERCYTIRNPFWYCIFCFGTSLGYELFYATFFPFWVWNLDSVVCRKIVNVWALVMYVGQALKDIIRWPRPASPPVVHMELDYAMEYGMPSTHAMVGVALPFSILYFTCDTYAYPFALGVSIAVIWCILVCCSRLYMGMHTVLDIIGGLMLAPVLMAIILPFSSYIDHFQQKNTYSPLVTFVVMIFLQMMYPKTTHWSPARGDTSVILGTGTGFAFGAWLNYHLGYVHGPSLPVPYYINIPNFEDVIMIFIRTIIGLLYILLARLVFKNLLHIAFCYFMKLNYKNPAARHNPIVEIPNKFITYIVIGSVITFFAPQLFRFLDIDRKSMQFEI